MDKISERKGLGSQMVMTDMAINKWKGLMQNLDRDADNTHLRLSIKGGGCSGFIK